MTTNLPLPVASDLCDGQVSPAVPAPDGGTPAPGRLRGRLATAFNGVLGAVMGLAPHVLHHVGPLVGTAVVAGSGGTAVFAVLGLLLSIPTLRTLRRRYGSWRAPALALVLFAALFVVSSTVVGPWISGAGEPAAPSPTGHLTHHE